MNNLYNNKEDKAERFLDWIAEVVLPTIKNGGSTPEEITGNGISAMSGMIPLQEYYDEVNYHLKKINESMEFYNKVYFDRFRDLERDGIYTIDDVYNFVLDKNKYNFMSDEELNKLLINLGFLCIDQAGHYHTNAEKVISLKPLTLTLRGLIELSYAIDNPGDIYFHF
jgi:hypothetical protein